MEVDRTGRRRRGRRNPTSELDLHLRILRRRADVGAVVHAHPPTATAFAVAGEELASFALPELIFLVGPVPLVPFGMPGTPELGDRIEPFLEGHDALLLANHGAVTLGRTLDEAWIRMETLEHAARILLGARLLGRVTELEPRRRGAARSAARAFVDGSGMAKAPSKSTAAIQRLLEERRQYEAWIARIDAAGGAAPSTVRSRVRSDYEARLNAVTEELKVHAEAARLMAAQRKELRRELQAKETQAAERLAEAELRHAVGEYDESQWTQVHKDSLAELVSVREELGSVDEDIGQLEELEQLVRARPNVAPAPAPAPPLPPVPAPAVPRDDRRPGGDGNDAARRIAAAADSRRPPAPPVPPRSNPIRPSRPRSRR